MKSILALLAALAVSDPVTALRERHLGPMGLPSEATYAQAHGILPVPGSETFDWQVVFKLTYRAGDLAGAGEPKPVHTDCYFVRTRKYTAALGVQPVWDGRVYQANDRLVVAAYTSKGERAYGRIDEQSRIIRSDDIATSGEFPQLNGANYNPFTGQLWRPSAGGNIEERQRCHLPLTMVNHGGQTVCPDAKIIPGKGNQFALVANGRGKRLTLATCSLHGKNAMRSRGYSPVLGPSSTMITSEPTTIVEVPGEIATDVLNTGGPQLILRPDISPWVDKPTVEIDGRFDEWRSIAGMADPEKDIPSYLGYNPDTDLLEFKVANDERYLYFYTRVAGRHGHTAAGKDRYYFYVYIDADRNPATGYLPTRDDDCYYGVTLGDDCEAQFEFVGGRFVKTFFGFAGRSTEKDVLTGRVALGPSWYNRHDEQGRLRDGYKVEYIRRGGKISITKDLSEGTSDDITVALSPDGSECEMRAEMSGFLAKANGEPIIAAGQSIDLAAGVEASGQARGNSKWGADSTAILRGYSIAK
ncbi:MAG TPA: hypothetical protein VJ809_00895 [Pirellulales bacterium]|nr:hypothetical protein [Pirellulales bacterium]